MNLTAEQILPLLFGAAETTVEHGVIIPRKVTASCLAAWDEISKTLGDRARNSTGVRLDFHTDADSVSFTVAGGKFDLLIDGLFAEQWICTDPEEVSASLPAGEHRVTLVFPSHSNGTLHGVSLSDGAAVRPHAYAKKLLFLGDSITHGWDSGKDSLSYAWQVSLFYDADCIIQGVGGAYFHPEVFDEDLDFEPDRVIVAFGTNDFGWGNPLETVRELTARYLDKAVARYGAEKVVCILPTWRSEESKHGKSDFYAACVSAIRGEEEARGVHMADGMTLVPHHPDFFLPDLLHPNALGFAQYAQNLIAFLTKETNFTL